MAWLKMGKRRTTDIEFSKIIRERDGWKCSRCGKPMEDQKELLDCSHYWGRKNECARFDPQNCIALCRGCHQYVETREGHELWYKPYMLEWLGEDAYHALMIRAQQVCKRDDKATKIYLKELRKELLWES